MNVPAIPRDVLAAASSFANCPPGHRFNLYFPIWRESDWQIDKNGKADALRQCLVISADGVALLKALRDRQQALAAALPEDQRQIVDAVSTAPFATGLGLEHPVDNGFAFLSPYGLPYLAGSGVKGVLRRAAEQLLESGEAAISQPLIDALFGRESDKDAWRGALACWDVFPAAAGARLVVEIMTPHFGDYYQKKGTPNDAGKPNPIPFLAVPARSEFRFVITCNTSRLPADHLDWKSRLEAIVAHAFDWLGFGAKTAIGYGALEEDLAAVEARRLQEETERRLAALAAENARRGELTPEARELESARAHIADLRHTFAVEKARGRYTPGTSAINEKRAGLFKLAGAWQSPTARREAWELLEETIRWTGWPANKQKKQQLESWLAALKS